MTRYIQYLVSMVCLVLISGALKAQVQDPASPGFDYNFADTTSTDTSYFMKEPKEGAKGSAVDPALRPYEKIVLSIDSTTNLISYSGVVEQEESGSDSLYFRAKKWADKYLGPESKIETDKRNQKLIYLATVPAYAYLNKYNKKRIGTYEMRIVMLFKEGRYKYQITNLVHESMKPTAGGKGIRNYFEYYYTSTNNVRLNDAILRSADHDIHILINTLKNALREPRLVDEDDW